MNKIRKNGAHYEDLLNFLRESRGFDFSVYKDSTLDRRIQKRMDDVRCRTVEAYLDYLQVHPEEFLLLLNSILINVTAFFRDPPIWDFIAKEMIPVLLRKTNSIRIWSAGCASGEEPYTLAMLLAEAIGVDGVQQRVKLYATDIDEGALADARRASYRADALKDVPESLRKKYFDLQGNRYVLKNELRRTVIFGRHNIVLDPPIPHLDLLLCRNTLMYFTAEVQAEIIERCAFALNDHGFLVVGKAETLLSRHKNFVPFKFNTKFRIFRKLPAGKETPAQYPQAARAAGNQRNRLPATPREKLERTTLSGIGSIAQVSLNQHGKILQVNTHARPLLGLTKTSVGKRIQDLRLSDNMTELVALIKRAVAQKKSLVLRDVSLQRPAGKYQNFDLEIVPLLAANGKYAGASIFFYDVTNIATLKAEHARAQQELETMYEELQAGNEELQSTNEELETTNEELQSANEELETMNEELQSSNDELRSANDQLEVRTLEAKQLSTFLQSVLNSQNAGVAVLDRGLIITAWNQKAEELWGVRQDEARGQSFEHLDFGFPADTMMQSIRNCLEGNRSVEIVVDATNRRGKRFQCRTSCSPLLDEHLNNQGAIVFMEEKPHEDGN